MEVLLNFLTNEINQMPLYPVYIHIAMIASIVVVTQLLKFPVKFLTKKISDKTIQEEVNVVIVFIPFGLGMLGSFILTFFGYEFCYTAGLSWGSSSQVVYKILERIVKGIAKGVKIKKEDVKKEAETAISEVKKKEDEFTKLVEEAKNKVKKGGE